MMLTQEQKDLLEPLTHHERYGKLLIDAIKIWETANPKQKTYGVSRWNDDYQNKWELQTDYNNCCLVGASVVGKSEKNSCTEEVMTAFNLSMLEALSLARGFDESDLYNEDFSAYSFGKKVARILFGFNKG